MVVTLNIQEFYDKKITPILFVMIILYVNFHNVHVDVVNEVVRV